MTTEYKVEPKADAEGKLDAILSAIGALASRVDEMEKNLPAPPLQMASDKKKDEEKEEKEEKEDEDEEKKDSSKISKKRKDEEDEDEDEERKDNLSTPEPKKGEGEFKGKAGEMRFDEEEKEEMEKADAQAKADSVYALFGKTASRPLVGETVESYRKRMLRGLQGYSDAYKEVNIASIKDSKLLDIAEKQIFADAQLASKNVSYSDGEIAITRKDATGRVITEFRGSMGWLDAFKMQPSRAVEWFTANKR
jgi:hypothetical protein